jgi:hypothetical protein
VTGRGEDGNHLAKQEAPRGLAVDEQHRIRIARADVHIVDAIVADRQVVRRVGEVGKILEAMVRRAVDAG